MKELKSAWLGLKNCVFVRLLWLLLGVGMVVYMARIDNPWTVRWVRSLKD